jgi:hypothetical protein
VNDVTLKMIAFDRNSKTIRNTFGVGIQSDILGFQQLVLPYKILGIVSSKKSKK